MKYIVAEDAIAVLPWSVRTHNGLRRAGIHTIGDLLAYPEEEFMSIRNMGVKSVKEIEDRLGELRRGDGEYVLVGVDDECFAAQKAEASVEESVRSVQDLPLSVRAKNALGKGGYQTAAQLIGITREELTSLRSMGAKTVDEVWAYVQTLSQEEDVRQMVFAGDEERQTLVEQMSASYGESDGVWLRAILTVQDTHPNALGETRLYHLYNVPSVREALKETILRHLEKSGDRLAQSALEQMLPPHLQNTTIVAKVLLELEADAAVRLGETTVYRCYPSIVDYAKTLDDDRYREVLEARLEGKTLQEIGDKYNLTRERVRQLLGKTLDSRKHPRPRLREDAYLAIFEQYDMSLEDFKLIFDETDTTYHYLEMISSVPHSKKASLEALLEDASVDPALRKKAERAVYKQYRMLDGVRVKMTRPEMVRHFVKTRCRGSFVYEDFLRMYNGWLEELGLGDRAGLIVDSRAYENKFSQCDYVLCSQWGRLRYYDIPANEYEELLGALALERFENVEISTLKLFREQDALMRQYDIRDEYELHNLLRKIWPADDTNVNFKRMPTVEFGTADVDYQLMSLLIQYAPISADDLALRYEEEYGVKAATVRGNIARVLDPYYYQGVYSIDYEELPSEQAARMKEVLTADFYPLSEVTRLYKREFPDADESMINPYTLKSLGFYVYSGYVIKNTYQNAADYFRSLLLKGDVVDMRAYDKAIHSLNTYTVELSKLRDSYEIVEFAPKQFIHIRRLQENGVTKEQLQAYGEAAARRTDKGELFTITSLRNDGFEHELDDLGFDDWFYASLLLADKTHFAATRIGGARLFLRGEGEATLGALLVQIIGACQQMEIYDLIDHLKEHYGISLIKDKLVHVLGGTQLYYDRIMETVYIDYDTYFEEL